jgi:hypothetical protein
VVNNRLGTDFLVADDTCKRARKIALTNGQGGASVIHRLMQLIRGPPSPESMSAGWTGISSHVHTYVHVRPVTLYPHAKCRGTPRTSSVGTLPYLLVLTLLIMVSWELGTVPKEVESPRAGGARC